MLCVPNKKTRQFAPAGKTNYHLRYELQLNKAYYNSMGIPL